MFDSANWWENEKDEEKYCNSWKIHSNNNYLIIYPQTNKIGIEK